MAIVASEPSLLVEVLFPEANRFRVLLIKSAMTGLA